MTADVNFQYMQDLSPLHYAVQGQNVDILNLLIEKMAEINSRSQQGYTPLHICCRLGQYEFVKILTKVPDIFVDIEDNIGNTPLHYATLSNQGKIVSHLVKNCKANPCIHNCQK